MSAGEDGDQREADYIVFAANYAAESLFKFGGFMGYGAVGLERHWLDSTILHSEGGVTYVMGKPSF